MSAIKYHLTWITWVILLSACSDSRSLQFIEGNAQGTTYHISYWSTESVDRTLLSQAVTQELADIDASMSGYRKDSTIEQFNNQLTTESLMVNSEIVSLVEKARAINLASSGCYDLTIKPMFTLWGFSNEQFAVPEASAVQEVLQTVGMDKLTTIDKTHLRKTIPSIKIDLSSIAQGYSVAKLAEILEHHGIQDYLVEIGGEMRVRGTKPNDQPWRVGIEKPLPQERSVEKVITLLGAQTLAVMTSGTYRHFYDEQGIRYSHILDARTGFPVTHHTVSVTVLYPDATMADAWSTALLCLGRETGVKIANQQGIPALFIDQSDDKLTETASEPLQHLQGIHIK